MIKYTSGNNVSTHQSNPSVDQVPACQASDQYHQLTELEPHLALIPAVADVSHQAKLRRTVDNKSMLLAVFTPTAIFVTES